MASRGLEQDKEQLVDSFEAVELMPPGKLRVSDESLRTFFDAIEQGAAIADVILNGAGEGVDYRIVAANAAFAALVGWPQAEPLIGKTARELIPSLREFWPKTMGQVAATGNPAHFEEYLASLDRWFDVRMVRVGDPSQHRIAAIYNDITEQRRAERALEVRRRIKAYLLKLSIQLRPIERPIDIMSAASEAVARELNVSAAGYIEMAGDGETALTGGQFGDGRLPALVGPCKLSEFGHGMGAALNAGQELFVQDILAYMQDAAGSEKAQSFKLRAVAAIPLMKNGKLVAFFYATHHEPRPWEGWEQEIFRQTAEWTWAAVERARAETALRENLEKYRTLFDSIDQGYMVIELLNDENGLPTDYKILQGNRAFEKQLGLSDYVGKTGIEIFSSSPDDRWLKFYVQVAATGEPARVEDFHDGMQRWYSVFASRVGGEGSRLVTVLLYDITPRKETEASRRVEEERHAYRWKLSDALRPLEDPIEIQSTALAVLGEELRVDRAFYGQVDAGRREILIQDHYARRQGASVAGRYPLNKHAWMEAALQAGLPVVVGDLRDTTVIPAVEHERLEPHKVGALIAIPLIKDGRVVASLAVTEPSPRVWTPLEVELVWHTGEVTWAALERAKVEAALRASEEKFRTLFNSIDNAIAVVEVLYDSRRRPDNLRFVETNRVFEQASGFKDHIGKTSQELLPNLEDLCIEKYARVAQTGEPVRFESYSHDFGCWMNIFASRLGGDGSRLVNIVFEDITERKQAEAELREREERKGYQLRLSDALRPLQDPMEIEAIASRLLGEELRADRAMYVEIDEVKGDVVAHDFARSGFSSLVGRRSLEGFGWGSPGFRRGRPTVVNDVDTAPFVEQEFVERMHAIGVVSFITVPLVKRDQLVATLCVANARPRIWTPSEVGRVQDTADRTWAAAERARAEAARRSSDEKYGTLFNSIDQGIAVVEVLYNERDEAVDLRFIETNRVWEAQNGVTNAAGRTTSEVLPQLGLACVQRYARVAETGVSGQFEAHVAELGIWLDIRATRVGGPGSRIVSIVFSDITDRKKSEDELRKSEERKAFLLKLSDALRLDANATEIQGTVARMLCEHLGADRAFYADIDEEVSEAVVERDYARAGASSLVGRYPLKVFGWMASSPKKGEAGLVQDVRTTTVIPESDRAKVAALQVIAFISVPMVKDNRVVGALCVTQMTPRNWGNDEFELVKETVERTWAAVERARAEAALRRSEERMQRVLETDTVGVLIFDWAGTVMQANDVFYRMTGYTREEVGSRSLTWQRMTPAEFIPSCERHVRNLKETGRLGPLEKEYIMKDGSRRWMLLAGRDLGDGTFSEYCIDITDRKRTESALRESEERFRAFLENVHEYAFVQCDRDLLITSWNPGAERIFGYSSQEALGQPFRLLLLVPEERGDEIPCVKIAELERQGRTEDARWLVRKDGQRIWTRWVSEPLRDADGRITGLTKVLRDETERLRAETSLRESEKLAVVGRMASSIAHEINNPLEAVTNLIFLARKATVSGQVADFLDVAQSELSRVSHISKATLHYHRQSSDPLKVDVGEVLESVLLLHEGRLRAAHISVDRRYGPHPPIRCKENEIRQVLANLVSNALDAMVKNPEERRCMNVRVRKGADAVTGEEGVRVMISDTGAGIGGETGKRVFEPFYTTKAATGTGLGLWISSETVKKHEGVLRFRSRTDGRFQGTVFSMFLKS